jgi:GNAT superfamily N-acetyltransferase
MLYDMEKDELLCWADLRRGENTLKALGYHGWVGRGIQASWAPLAKSEKRSSPFRAAAFQGANGTVYETGPFHDAEALPADVEVSAEGFVDTEGRFFTREQATAQLAADHPVQSEELELSKSMRDIPEGQHLGDNKWDYGHLLGDDHRKSHPNLRLTATSVGDDVSVALHDGDRMVGNVRGTVKLVNWSRGPRRVLEPHSFLDPSYRRQGLGRAMYEAALKHAHHHHGARGVWGHDVSEAAFRLHESLGADHDFNLKGGGDGQDFNYSYILKNEDAAGLKKADGDVTWYHGTSGAAARQAAPQGYLRPGSVKAKRGFTVPMENRVYLTRDPGKALKYADWKAHSEHGHPEAAILKVSPDMSKVVPDEDWLGALVLHGELQHRSNHWYSDIPQKHPLWDQLMATLAAHPVHKAIKGLSDYDCDRVQHQARIGKRVIKALQAKNPQLLQALTEEAPSVAHEGPLRIASAHVFPRSASPHFRAPHEVDWQSHATPLEVGLNKSEVKENTHGINNNFDQAANKWLENKGLGKLNQEEIRTRLHDLKETLEAIATQQGQHPAFQAAARMSGSKADAERRRQAELVHGDDVVAVALAAHGLDPEDESLRMTVEAAMQQLRLGKSEEFRPAVLPRVVEPGQQGSDHMAMVIRQAYASNLVYEVQLGGKHSAGTAVAYDQHEDRFWLLKPGSARVSPALGVSETPYSQSRREVAFAQAARAYESMRAFYPECWLLKLDGREVACMEVMGPGYRPAQKYGDDEELLKPYQDSLDIYRWAAFDWVLGNPDCHGGNVLVTEDGRVSLIDHGSALAGKSFNPPTDQGKSFIPYYLRVFRDIDWKTATPEARYNAFPQPTPEERQTISAWLRSLGDKWMQSIEDLAPEVLGICNQRLQAITEAKDPADTLLRLWAGLGPDHDLSKAEEPYDIWTRAAAKNPEIDAFTPGAGTEDLLAHGRWASQQTGIAANQITNFTRQMLRIGKVDELKDFIHRMPAAVLMTLRDNWEGTVAEGIAKALDGYEYDNRGQDLKLNEPSQDVRSALIQRLSSPEVMKLTATDERLRQRGAQLSSRVLRNASEQDLIGYLSSMEKHIHDKLDETAFYLAGGHHAGGNPVARNPNLGKAFIDWVKQSESGYRFLPKAREGGTDVLKHLSREDLVNLLQKNGREVLYKRGDLLELPQLTEPDIHKLVTPHLTMDELVARHGDDAEKMWAETNFVDNLATKVIENGRSGAMGNKQTLVEALLSHPLLLTHNAAALGHQGYELAPDVLRRAVQHEIRERGGESLGNLIVKQLHANPASTVVRQLAHEHAEAVINHIDEEGIPFEVDGKEPSHWKFETPARVARWRNDAALEQGLKQELLSNALVKKNMAQKKLLKFWLNYEQDVSPHHFATAQRFLNGTPEHVELPYHRKGEVGTSRKWDGVEDAMHDHAKKVQEAVLGDPNAVIQHIDGKPHILVYRGVAGNYAHKVIEALEGGATSIEVPNAQFSSWTGLPRVARDFAKRDIDGHAYAGLIMRQWMPVEDILHSGCHAVHPQQEHAHPHERELVFKHTTPHTKVFAGDICLTRHPRGAGAIENLLESTPVSAHTDFQSEHETIAKPHVTEGSTPGMFGHGGHSDY